MNKNKISSFKEIVKISEIPQIIFRKTNKQQNMERKRKNKCKF